MNNGTHGDLTGRKGLEMSLDVERDSVRVPQRVGLDEQMRSMKIPQKGNIYSNTYQLTLINATGKSPGLIHCVQTQRFNVRPHPDVAFCDASPLIFVQVIIDPVNNIMVVVG